MYAVYYGYSVCVAIHVTILNLAIISLTNSELVTLQLFVVLQAKSDSDVMFYLQKYQGFIIDRSLVY